jgi:hypothetical protein
MLKGLLRAKVPSLQWITVVFESRHLSRRHPHWRIHVIAAYQLDMDFEDPFERRLFDYFKEKFDQDARYTLANIIGSGVSGYCMKLDRRSPEPGERTSIIVKVTSEELTSFDEVPEGGNKPWDPWVETELIAMRVG